MTINGTVNKTGILLILALATAAWTWHVFMQSLDMAAVNPLMLLGVFGCNVPVSGILVLRCLGLGTSRRHAG